MVRCENLTTKLVRETKYITWHNPIALRILLLALVMFISTETITRYVLQT
jgi:ABC-type tungstate transport system substrate-binding protein